MVVQISTRKSIRWVPDPPSEPTSTLVLDVGTHFLDLRTQLSTSTIEWAMAGTRTVISTCPLKCRWTKEICSRNTESQDDFGEFEDLPNGDSLEKGRMLNGEGVMREYEEVWAEVVVEGDGVNWIVRGEDERGVCFLGRVGGYYQGLRKRRDGGFDALREVKEEGEWVEKFKVGAGLVSMGELEEDGVDVTGWKEGMEVVLRKMKFQVLAVEKS